MTPPDRRKLVIGLSASLLLNMFLAGFIATTWLGHGHKRGHEHHRGQGRQAMHLLLKEQPEQRQALRDSRRQVRKARRSVRDALVADPLDLQTLESALNGLRAATGGAQEALHQALLKAVPTLSLEERIQLSETHRLWKAGHGRRGHHRPGHHGPKGPATP